MPTIIFKETEACNSNCIYCSVVHRKEPKTITADLLELAFVRVDEYLKHHPEENMQIIWHGGEPCIAGIPFYENVLLFQDRHCSETKDRIGHAVQSNLTLLTDEFAKMFKKMGVKCIGTSYDPYPGIRGFGAKRDTHAYNKAFMRGTQILDENDINWGFIYVVTKTVLDKPLEVFQLLTNFRLTGGFNIHPVLLYKNIDNYNLGITPAEYAHFLGTIFPVWYKNKDRYPSVDPFKSYLEHYTTGGSITCNDSGRCAYTHLYIGPSGNTSHCGRAADWDVISYGNIKDRTLLEIFSDSKRDLINQRHLVLPETECKDCEYWTICNGGCPLDAWNKHDDFLHKTEWCAINKIFLKKYFEPVTGLKPKFHYKPEPELN
jgi:uncharacterized protein